MSGSALPSANELLEQPAVRASRRMALALLDGVVQARGGLDAGTDREALHDFRVALRRLRSHIKAYRAPLRGSVKRKATRWLRDLARATSASRDAEVHLAWLDEQRASFSPRQRAGLTWMAARLAVTKVEADAGLAVALADDFEARGRALGARLETYQLQLHVRGTIITPSLALVAADLVATHAEMLRAALARVHDARDVDKAHEARIAGKRLRYLLEPLVCASSDGPALVTALKSLQDTLGDLHDAHVFSEDIAHSARDAATEDADRLAAAVRRGRGEAGGTGRARRDPRPGLLELGERLRARGERAFDAAKAEWLGGAADPFFERVAAFVERLRELGQSAPDVEIERKYLLRALPPHVRDADVRDIEQGYLPGSRLIERLRREDTSDGDGKRFFRTVKVGAGVTRMELEEETTEPVFDAMWPLTEGRRVRKRRYVVAEEHQVWEIDEFLDRDLVLAEIELDDADTTVELPKWLASFIVREVTDEAAYVNVNLAR